MIIYATIVSSLLVVSFIVNCMLIHGINQMIRENEFLEEQLNVEG